MNDIFVLERWIFWKARFIASYKFVKTCEPRAIARFGGIFSCSCFSRSVWSHEPWCQPCKLRYTVVSMSHIISAGTKGQHIRPLWPLLRLGSKIMLLRMGLLLRLGSNVITWWDLYCTWVQLLHLCLQHTSSYIWCNTLSITWLTSCVRVLTFVSLLLPRTLSCRYRCVACHPSHFLTQLFSGKLIDWLIESLQKYKNAVYHSVSTGILK